MSYKSNGVWGKILGEVRTIFFMWILTINNSNSLPDTLYKSLLQKPLFIAPKTLWENMYIKKYLLYLRSDSVWANENIIRNEMGGTEKKISRIFSNAILSFRNVLKRTIGNKAFVQFSIFLMKGHSGTFCMHIYTH